MQQSSSLQEVKTFLELWEDTEIREARRTTYKSLLPLANLVWPQDREKIERYVVGVDEEERKAIDQVIYRSNLIGLLWDEEFLSENTRNRVIGYIYKTAIISWDSLKPYIDFVRAQRSEKPGQITYARPFERLVLAAEKRLGNQARPKPSEY